MEATLPNLIAALVLFLFTTQAVTATNEQLQWRGTVIAQIDGKTPEQAWPLFEDFCGGYKIIDFHNVTFCVGRVPGRDRYMASKVPSPSGDNTTWVRWEKHRLLAMDPIKRYLTYEMRENNRSIKRYVATLSLSRAKYGTRLTWVYAMDPLTGLTHEQVEAEIKEIIQQMKQHVEKA